MRQNKWNDSAQAAYPRYSKGGEYNSADSSRKTTAPWNQIPGDALVATPLEVKVNGNFDRAFKIFRALVQKERILSAFKEKQEFEKPSDKKRRKSNEARRKSFEMEMRYQKMLSGDLDKERLKKEAAKEQRELDDQKRVED